MTIVRLLVCTIALAASACATHVRAAQPTTAPAHYNLCSDPSFECVPATQPAAAERAIQVDTNLTAPASATAQT